MRQLKSLNSNKKGIIGLDTVKAVMVTILALAIIGVAIVIVLTTLDESDIVRDSKSETNLNDTLTTVSEIGEYFTNYSLESASCTVTYVQNETSGGVINSGNYTTNNCWIQFSGADLTYNNSNWNVSYTYTYDVNYVEGIKENVTEGIVDFFSNTTTIFAILVVVVIILAITIIIVAVSRFSGEGNGFNIGPIKFE